ncbi:hypothetical protein HC723_08300 [Vibrio sp. S11_S32]|uniref:hypothetical protein n=1 Tax=Vibrio sp. S11_S32 TaxID=2720225 RepID=UPI0016811F41|nr:hypothetical protein [Vibrio sp. S11_S32]MBD1576437.1 hypothetical protein [Vibrio sp. S11_S32]
MKAFTIPLTFVVVSLLAACSSQAPTEPQELKPQTTELSVVKTVDVLPYMLSGEISFKDNGYQIQPCNSSIQYWLELPAPILAQLNQMRTDGNGPFYAELFGELQPTPTKGNSSAYVARFLVSDLNQIASETGNKCQTTNTALRAFGNEPNWSLSIAKGQVTKTSISNKKTTSNVNDSNISPTQRRYQFEKNDLTLNKQTCQDTMSGALYAWNAAFNTKDKTLHGCATLANQDNAQQYVATYQSQPDASGLTTQLELQPDHTATTRYIYKNGDPSLIETGYWQQANGQQLHVVMTQHQGEAVVSQRLFTIRGFQLHADSEQINNQIYPIGINGLSLDRMQSAVTMVEGENSKTQGVLPTLTPAAINASTQFDAKVDKAMRNYFAINRTDPSGNRYIWLKYDLNGDGNDELLAMMNWCGSGGCTMLIFENQNNEWRFNSRITCVRNPITVANYQHNGWRDLVVPVSGGGAKAAQKALEYTGVSYPNNASMASDFNTDNGASLSSVVLFADQTPAIKGVKM